MATEFSCNPEAAGQASQTLAQIAAEMQNGIQVPEDAGAAIGSPPGYDAAAQALSNFYTAASSVHAKVASRVDGSSRLLGNLAQGTQEIDQDLARELGLSGPASPFGAAPGPGMQRTTAGGVSQASAPLADGAPAGGVPAAPGQAGAVPAGAGRASSGGPATAAAQLGGEAEDDPVQAMGEALAQLSQLVPPGTAPPPSDQRKHDGGTKNG